MGSRIEDLKRFDKIVETAQKMKKVMLKRGITDAKAVCPFCRDGFLYATIGASHSRRGATSSRQYVRMSCTTPKCTTYME